MGPADPVHSLMIAFMYPAWIGQEYAAGMMGMFVWTPFTVCSSHVMRPGAFVVTVLETVVVADVVSVEVPEVDMDVVAVDVTVDVAVVRSQEYTSRSFLASIVLRTPTALSQDTPLALTSSYTRLLE